MAVRPSTARAASPGSTCVARKTMIDTAISETTARTSRLARNVQPLSPRGTPQLRRKVKDRPRRASDPFARPLQPRSRTAKFIRSFNPSTVCGTDRGRPGIPSGSARPSAPCRWQGPSSGSSGDGGRLPLLSRRLQEHVRQSPIGVRREVHPRPSRERLGVCRAMRKGLRRVHQAMLSHAFGAISPS